jgi:hypothetical protein
MIDDQHSRLRKISQDLYMSDMAPQKKRSVLHEEKVVYEDAWKDAVKDTSFTPAVRRIPNTSLYKKMFLGSLFFLVIALVVFGVSFITGGNTISEKNVDLVITTKSFVDGGESLPVEVTLVNKNKLPLELATLVLEYPEGNQDGSLASGASARISRDIGTLGSGATRQESFIIQLYGMENSERAISAHLDFRVQGSNAIYDKDQSVAVTIRTSPVTITLSAPDQAIPNQEIPLKFSIVGNGTATLPNTAMILEYPSGFTFTKADPSPAYGNNVWYLGDLPPGTNRTITVYGSLTGSVTDLKTIKAAIGLQSVKSEDKLDTTYNTLAQIIPLANAFLDAHIEVSSLANQTASGVAINGNQQVQARIVYKNTLSVPITNAELSIAFSGTAYDPALVQPMAAYFDSANNKLRWTKQQDPTLASIGPGQQGSLTFAFKPRQLTGGNANNPTIKTVLDVIGYQSGGTKLTAQAIDTKAFTVNSDLNLLVRSIHYTGAIQNTGPMPPVPNKETTYTLEFKITNTRNRVAGAKLSTVLPTYVTWKNVIVPQSDAANVSYNEVTRELVWNIGEITGGATGMAPKIISMKVGITPSSSQLGSAPQLTGPITLSGKDTFTNADLTVTKLPITTQVLNDGNGPGTYGQVGQ